MTITYRATKGSALLYGELDENFRDLREDTDLQRVLTNGNTSNLSLTSLNVTATNNVIANNRLIIKQTSTPASSSATGTKGTIVWDSQHVYICVDTDTWKRISLSSF